MEKIKAKIKRKMTISERVCYFIVFPFMVTILLAVIVALCIIGWPLILFGYIDTEDKFKGTPEELAEKIKELDLRQVSESNNKFDA